ncbi:MAG: biotin--[acetyl-CoA-carboxylase] ligase, partial [Actinomycetota bacterium]
MSGPPYDDLGRPPLDGRALAAALTVPAGPWRELRVVAETGSTQADLALAAQGGAGEGLVLVAERQRAGRGRLDRSWVSPPRAGLTFSVLLRPGPPEARWGWLSLLGGVAVAVAVQRVTGVAAAVKWPNDVLVEGRKLAGVLAERVAGAVVLGVGLNVSQAAGELPGPAATSLVLEGVAVD